MRLTKYFSNDVIDTTSSTMATSSPPSDAARVVPDAACSQSGLDLDSCSRDFRSDSRAASRRAGLLSPDTSPSSGTTEGDAGAEVGGDGVAVFVTGDDDAHGDDGGTGTAGRSRTVPAASSSFLRPHWNKTLSIQSSVKTITK